ncbi:hypothetical protein PIB30_053124 [Stylosanthes scabra]|uniref:Uncharacterized protein n=1 Tax=Stylosanthes scabra TaxID=79078 RepID=A0ABU6XHB5_9FABA|nr:hypothetical protein [Stylosanthes scabra]
MLDPPLPQGVALPSNRESSLLIRSYCHCSAAGTVAKSAIFVSTSLAASSSVSSPSTAVPPLQSPIVHIPAISTPLSPLLGPLWKLIPPLLFYRRSAAAPRLHGSKVFAFAVLRPDPVPASLFVVLRKHSG